MYIWVTAQKMKFSKFPVDLVIFTEEILNENFIFCAVGHFGCSRTIRLLSFFFFRVFLLSLLPLFCCKIICSRESFMHDTQIRCETDKSVDKANS